MVNDLLIIPATARLTKLINEDKIFEPLRDRIHAKFPRKSSYEPSMPGYLITCPWCMSMWAGSALTLLSMTAPKTSKAVNIALTASYFTGFMTQHVEEYFNNKNSF